MHKAPACLPVSLAAMGPVGGTPSPAPTASILLGLADVLVRRPCTAVLVAWVASARGRSACRRRRKPGQKKIFLRQRSPQPRRKQARAHRQVKGLPDSLLRLRRLASSFALRRAGLFVSSKERTLGRPGGSSRLRAAVGRAAGHPREARGECREASKKKNDNFT